MRRRFTIKTLFCDHIDFLISQILFGDIKNNLWHFVVSQKTMISQNRFFDI